jgi:uncharacterized membrane protein YoaK (UPF0700 family)
VDLVTANCLAFVGGFVDAAGFVALAGLFTSHVTGDFVLLSEGLASDLPISFAKAAALPVFMAAVCLARFVSLGFERRGVTPLRPLLALEALLLLAFVACGELMSLAQFSTSTTSLFTGMCALAAMGVQNAIGRLAIAHMPATTVMTVNVSQMTLDAVDVWRGLPSQGNEAARARLWRTAPAVLSFALGTLTGAVGTLFRSFSATVVPVAVIVGLLAFLALDSAKRRRADDVTCQ